MPLWSMDDWQYVERQIVTDPKGRQWSIALMDILGQEGDAEMPSKLLEIQYASGRYFTVIYSATGALQWERGHTSRSEAEITYQGLLASVVDGRLDPAQPVFRENLED
jgi:hypothetical protein